MTNDPPATPAQRDQPRQRLSIPDAQLRGALLKLAESGQKPFHVVGVAESRSRVLRWQETVTMRSSVLSVLLSVRASRVPNPVSGLWTDIDDLDGLAAFAHQNRGLGYEGMMCIHPSHVSVINAAFTPSDAELDRDRALVEAMREAAEGGRGATIFDGEMIDEATAVTARTRVEKHGSLRD